MLESVHQLKDRADPTDIGVDGCLTHKLVGKECVEGNLDLNKIRKNYTHEFC